MSPIPPWTTSPLQGSPTLQWLPMSVSASTPWPTTTSLRVALVFGRVLRPHVNTQSRLKVSTGHKQTMHILADTTHTAYHTLKRMHKPYLLCNHVCFLQIYGLSKPFMYLGCKTQLYFMCCFPKYGNVFHPCVSSAFFLTI